MKSFRDYVDNIIHSLKDYTNNEITINNNDIDQDIDDISICGLLYVINSKLKIKTQKGNFYYPMNQIYEDYQNKQLENKVVSKVKNQVNNYQFWNSIKNNNIDNVPNNTLLFIRRKCCGYTEYLVGEISIIDNMIEIEYADGSIESMVDQDSIDLSWAYIPD